MGMQGPLTAQALGRSPYDDVVPGEGEEDIHDTRQQYDHRGRPFNPDTKRINRDMIRSHNEVMLVVGVAEPENPQVPPEAEANKAHHDYEESIGARLVWGTKRCLEAVGVFGVTGARERILVYQKFSEIPFGEFYKAARSNTAISKALLPGAPASLLAQYIERRFTPPWYYYDNFTLTTYCTHQLWYYIISHLELYAAFQRLGLISSAQLYPTWKYFIPFTSSSPIQPPPPLEDLTPRSLLTWVGGVLISVAPFLLWDITKRIARDWRANMFPRVLSKIPNPMTSERTIGPLPIPPPPAGSDTVRDVHSPPGPSHVPEEDGHVFEREGNPSPEGPNNPDRRASVHSAGGAEEYASDEDDHEVVSATLISFDVEATEATDVPQGLWSAELRPSIGPESRQSGRLASVYFSTMLTKLPAAMAGKIFNDLLVRMMIAPYEAMALRLAARAFRITHGLPVYDILSMHPLSGLNVTWLVNFLGLELIHLGLAGEVWAIFTNLSQYFHKSEDEWKEYYQDNKDKEIWGGQFRNNEPWY